MAILPPVISPVPGPSQGGSVTGPSPPPSSPESPLFHSYDLPMYSSSSHSLYPPILSTHSSSTLSLPTYASSPHSSPIPSPAPGPSTDMATSVETDAASHGLKPGDAVNVLTRGRPWLAAIVEQIDGDHITYFHPALKVKRSYVVSLSFARPYQPQCVDGKIKLLNEIRGKTKNRNFKKLVSFYEKGLNEFLKR